MPATIGELRYSGHDELQRDIENLKRAAELNGIDHVFKTSASPGILAYRREGGGGGAARRGL